MRRSTNKRCGRDSRDVTSDRTRNWEGSNEVVDATAVQVVAIPTQPATHNVDGGSVGARVAAGIHMPLPGALHFTPERRRQMPSPLDNLESGVTSKLTIKSHFQTATAPPARDPTNGCPSRLSQVAFFRSTPAGGLSERGQPEAARNANMGHGATVSNPCNIMPSLPPSRRLPVK